MKKLMWLFLALFLLAGCQEDKISIPDCEQMAESQVVTFTGQRMGKNFYFVIVRFSEQDWKDYTDHPEFFRFERRNMQIKKIEGTK